jgi:hypothetical protein
MDGRPCGGCRNSLGFRTERRQHGVSFAAAGCRTDAREPNVARASSQLRIRVGGWAKSEKAAKTQLLDPKINRPTPARSTRWPFTPMAGSWPRRPPTAVSWSATSARTAPSSRSPPRCFPSMPWPSRRTAWPWRSRAALMAPSGTSPKSAPGSRTSASTGRPASPGFPAPAPSPPTVEVDPTEIIVKSERSTRNRHPTNVKQPPKARKPTLHGCHDSADRWVSWNPFRIQRPATFFVRQSAPRPQQDPLLGSRRRSGDLV